MATNVLDSQSRYELYQYLEKVTAEKGKLPYAMLRIMASEHFGRQFQVSHIRNTILKFKLYETIKKNKMQVLQPIQVIRERRINKKTFKCDCGQRFVIRIRKCK